jgi:hypothetical protein
MPLIYSFSKLHLVVTLSGSCDKSREPNVERQIVGRSLQSYILIRSILRFHKLLTIVRSSERRPLPRT